MSDYPETSISSKPPEKASDFLLAEYSALRNEILKRTEIQHQLLAMALTAAGVFMALGGQGSALAYPILATFLAAAWAQNDMRSRRMGVYVREQIETRLRYPESGWQHVLRSTSSSNIGLGAWLTTSPTRLSAAGFFIASEILVPLVACHFLPTSRLKDPDTTIALLRGALPINSWWFVLVAGASVLVTSLSLWSAHQNAERPRNWNRVPTFRPTRADKPFLLAADIDGTLLGDKDGEDCLRRFIQDHGKSLRFAVVTGRTLRSVERLISEGRLPQPDYIASSVGTELTGCDAGKSGLCNKYAHLVTRPWEAEKIYEVGEGKGISRQNFEVGLPKFHAGFCWDGTDETLAAFRERVATVPGCRVVVSSGRYIDVIPEQIGKGEVVRFLQKELEVDHARVVVAGDSGNDMEMFETDFNGVVPENAFAELKLFARQRRHYHSAFPAALGVLDGLRHFGLVKPVPWWSR
jgi:HAD superfamily hydrolase (TIGR01484 family)